MSVLSQQDTSRALVAFFDRRKASFLASLQHILAAVTSDLFIQQMFEDPASAMYIPDRVCELVRRFLFDDRESILQDLYYRFRALEACLGSERIQQIEELGKKIIDAINAKVDPAVASHQYQQQLNTIFNSNPNEENHPTLNKIQAQRLLKIIVQFQDFLLFMKEVIVQLAAFIHSNNQSVKTKTKKILITLIANLKESQQREKQYKTQFEEATKRFTKVDIPRIKKHFEDEINRHIQNEESLQKSLNKVKRAILKISKEHTQTIEELNQLKIQMAKSKTLTESVENSERKNAELQGIITSLQKELKNKDSKIEQLLNDTQNSTIHNTALQETIATSKNQVIQKDEEIKKLKDDLVKKQLIIEEKENAKSLIEIDLQMLKTKLSIIPALESERNELNERYNELENEHIELEKSFQQLKTQLENEREERKQNMEEANQTFLNKYEIMNEENVQYKKENDFLTQEIERLRQMMSEKIEINNKLEISNKQSQKENKNLQKMIKEREDALLIVKDQYNLLTEENEDLKSQITSINEQLSDLNSNLKIYQQQLTQKEHEITRLIEEKEKVNQECKELQKKLAEALQESSIVQTTISQNNESLFYAQDEIKKKNLVIEQLMKAEEQRNIEMNKLSTKIEELHQEITESKSTITSKDNKIKTLTQQLNAIQGQNEALVENIQKYDAKLKKTLQLKSELDRQNIELQNEIQTQQSDIEILQNNSKLLQAKISESQTHIKQLNTNIESIEKVRNLIINEKNLLQNQLLEDRKRYKEEINEVQRKLSETNILKNKYEQQLNQAQYEIESLNSNISDKDHEISQEKEKSSKESAILLRQNEILTNDFTVLKEKHEKLNRFIKSIQESINNIDPNMTKLEFIPEEISKLIEIKNFNMSLISSLQSMLSIDYFNKDEQSDGKDEQSDGKDLILEKVNDKIIKTLQSIISQNSNLKEREEGLLNILMENDKKSNIDMIKTFKKLKDNSIKLKNMHDQIMSIININDSEDLLDQIELINEKYKIANKIEKSINQILPLATLDSIPTEMKQLMEKINSYDKNEKNILVLLDKNDPNDIQTTLKEMKDKIADDHQTIKDIKTIVSDLFDENKMTVVDAVKKLKTDQTRLLTEQNKTRENAPIKYSEKPLSEIMGILVTENMKLKEEQNGALNLLSSGEGNLSNKLSKILNELNNMKHFHESLRLLIGDDNIEQKIKSIMHENDEYETQIQALGSILQDYTDGSILQRVSRILQQKNALQSELNKTQSLLSDYPSSTLNGQVCEVIKQLKVNENVMQTLLDTIPEDIKAVKSYNENSSFISKLPTYVKELSKQYKLLKEKNNDLLELFPSEINGNSLEDKISELIARNSEYKRRESFIQKIIPIEYSNPKIEVQISTIIDELLNLRKLKEDVIKNIPEKFQSKGELDEQIMYLVNKVEKLKALKNNIKIFIPNDVKLKENNIESGISTLSNLFSSLKEQKNRCIKLIPEEISQYGDDIEANIASLSQKFKSMKEKQEYYNKIIPDEFKVNGTNFENQLYNLAEQYRSLSNKENSYKALISKEIDQSSSDLEQQMRTLIDLYNNMKDQQNKYEKMMPYDVSKDNRIFENQLGVLINKFERLKNIHERCNDLIPPDISPKKRPIRIDSNSNLFFSPIKSYNSINIDTENLSQSREIAVQTPPHRQDDYPDQVRPNQSIGELEPRLSNLINKYENMKVQQNKYEEMIPDEIHKNGIDFETQLNDLTNEYEFLMNLQNNIKKNMPKEFIDYSDDVLSNFKSFVNKYENMKAEQEKYEKIIPLDIKVKYNDLDSQLSQLVDQYKELVDKEAKIRKLIPNDYLSNQSDIVSAIASLTSNFKQLKEQQQKNFDLIPEEFTKDESDPNNQIASLVNNYKKLCKQVQNISNKIPREFIGKNKNIENQFDELVNQYKDLENQQEYFISIIPNNIKSNGNLADQIKLLVRKYNALQKQNDKFDTILSDDESLGNEATLQDKLNHLLHKYKEAQDENNSIRKQLPSGDNISKTLSKLIKEKEKHEAINKQIEDLLPDDFTGDVVSRVSNMIKERKSIKSIINDTTQPLNDSVKSMVKQNMICSQLKSIFPDEKIDNIPHQITKILETQKTLSKDLGTDDIKSAVNRIQSQITKIRSMFLNNDNENSTPERIDVVESVKRTLNNLSNIYKTAGISSNKDIMAKIKEFREGLESACDLVTNILIILSGSTINKIDPITFPLSNEGYQKLINLITAYKNKNIKIKSSVDDIIAMAKAIGFIGREPKEAVLYIKEHAIQEERQSSMEKMSQELSSVRLIHERERNLNEKQKEKLRKKIFEQRETISQLQEKIIQKEDEFQGEVEKHQKTARTATNECELQKRIHEELIRVIAGQPIDSEYLKAHLQPKELQLILGKENDLQKVL